MATGLPTLPQGISARPFPHRLPPPSLTSLSSKTYTHMRRINNKHAHVRNEKEIKKMELLTVVLTILADGGSVPRCRATAGSTEICLEGAEAVGFLSKEAHFRCKGEGEKLSRDGSRERMEASISPVILAWGSFCNYGLSHSRWIDTLGKHRQIHKIPTGVFLPHVIGVVIWIKKKKKRAWHTVGDQVTIPFALTTCLFGLFNDIL